MFTFFNAGHLMKALLLILFTLAPMTTDFTFLLFFTAFAAMDVTL